MARALRAVLAGVLAAGLLTGCGVRLDTPPPEVPAADAAEQARQDAARAAAELHTAARAAQAGTEDPAFTAALIAVETAAAEHHAALGGAWEPWPGAGPEATAYPGPDPSPAATESPDAAPADVLAVLQDAAAAARTGAVDQPGELGTLLGSVAISRTYLAVDLGDALADSADTLPAEPLPVPEPGTVDPQTSRALDAARYAFEVVAARSSGGTRDAALDRSAHLAEVAGAVAPEEDRREVAYDVTGHEGLRDLAAAAELDVLRGYLTLLAGDGAERATVLAAATYAAGQARSWDGTLPALPGLS